MTRLSDYFDTGNFYDTSDATVVVDDLPFGVIAYGSSGRLQATLDFADVALLLHMNGADTSTTFTDDSNNSHVATANGNAQIDTAQSKFGGASGLFDGSGDYLSIPYVTGDFDWFTEDYTIEAWVRANAAWTTWGTSGTGAPSLIGRADPSGATNYWSFGPGHDGKIRFYYYNGASVVLVGTTVMSADTWYHVAMSYLATSGAIKLFVNGVVEVDTTKSGTPQSVAQNLVIGQANSNSINGWVDDLRIIRGTAIYTEAFTPPTSEHPDS